MLWLRELASWLFGGGCRRCGAPASLCSDCAAAAQAAIPTADARICVECEVLFAGSLTCPKCGSRTNWIPAPLGDRKHVKRRRALLARQSVARSDEQPNVLTWSGRR